MKYNPHAYQDHASRHIIENLGAGLFLEMGLGKTVSALTAANELLYGTLEVGRILVVGPLRVAREVWTDERDKWDHLKHIRISKVIGDEKTRVTALRVPADIYVTNVEQIVWLTAYYGSAWPFDMVILDESSKFKDQSTRRFKALRKKLPYIKRLVLLTGSPASNGLMGLWSQMFLLDRGQRLGETITSYRDKYFRKKDNGFGYEIRRESKDSVLGEGIYEKEIYDKISDICISMKTADYLQLPERVSNVVNVTLEPGTLKKYLQFEKDCILQLDSAEVTAVNAGVLTNKLLQYANGAVYDDKQSWHEVHAAKLEALEEIIEEANGENVLVAYSFKSDLERILARFSGSNIRTLKTTQDFKDWNSGEINVGLIHPKSAGHGLNLQYGGHIFAWFGKSWSLEDSEQAPARIYRQGLKKTFIEHHIVVKGTMDEDVMKSLQSKETIQNALMKAVKARLKKYRNE